MDICTPTPSATVAPGFCQGGQLCTAANQTEQRPVFGVDPLVKPADELTDQGWSVLNSAQSMADAAHQQLVCPLDAKDAVNKWGQTARGSRKSYVSPNRDLFRPL
jgi:hypothetical protein